MDHFQAHSAFDIFTEADIKVDCYIAVGQLECSLHQVMVMVTLGDQFTDYHTASFKRLF